MALHTHARWLSTDTEGSVRIRIRTTTGEERTASVPMSAHEGDVALNDNAYDEAPAGGALILVDDAGEYLPLQRVAHFRLRENGEHLAGEFTMRDGRVCTYTVTLVADDASVGGQQGAR